jgi:hypothetical protein
MNEQVKGSGLTLGDFWREADIGDESSLAAARGVLERKGEDGARNPWFVRVLQILGAWLAAVFFVGFMGVADMLKNGEANIVIGAVMIAVATGLTRVGKGNLFVEQALTAFSIAGHLIFVAGVWNEVGELASAVAVGVLLLATYPLFRVAVHRVFACNLPAATLLVASLSEKVPQANTITIAIAGVVFALLHSGRFTRAVWRPASYSAGVILIGVPLFLMWWMSAGWDWRAFGSGYRPWISALVIGLIFLVLAWSLLRPGSGRTWAIFGCAGVVLMGVGLFVDAAVAASLWIFVIGHMRGDRWLHWLGLLGIGLSLSVYYYQLDVSLLTKSITLGVVGAVLLGMQFLWARLPSGEAETVLN